MAKKRAESPESLLAKKTASSRELDARPLVSSISLLVSAPVGRGARHTRHVAEVTTTSAPGSRRRHPDVASVASVASAASEQDSEQDKVRARIASAQRPARMREWVPRPAPSR